MKFIKITLFLSLFIINNAFAQEIILEPDSVLKKKVIKVEFFSPLTGNLTFGYEKYLKDFTSIEMRLGIIGIGTQEFYNATGIFVKAGPKFKLKPSYATKGTFGTHLLRGSYIRPEIAFSVFNWKTDDIYSDNEEKNIRSVALLINYGRQFVLGKIMSLDWHVGIGYGISNDDTQGYYFGYTAGDGSFPIAFSTGFTLGFLMK